MPLRFFKRVKKSSAASFGLFHQKRYLTQTLEVFPSPHVFWKKPSAIPQDGQTVASFRFLQKRDHQLPLGFSKRVKSHQLPLLDFAAVEGPSSQERFFHLPPTEKSVFFQFLSLREVLTQEIIGRVCTRLALIMS